MPPRGFVVRLDESDIEKMWRGYRQALSLLPIENVAQGRQAAQSVSPSASVRRAVVDMVKWRQGSLMVRDSEDGPILGTVTERDVLERVELVAGAMQATRVDQIMTPRSELASCSTDSALGECVRKMQPGFRQLPIVAGERVLAIISIRDIAQHMATALSKAPMHDPPAVEHLMIARNTPGYVELQAEATVADAVALMRETKSGSVLVASSGGGTFGVITERDYITKAAGAARAPALASATNTHRHGHAPRLPRLAPTFCLAVSVRLDSAPQCTTRWTRTACPWRRCPRPSPPPRLGLRPRLRSCPRPRLSLSLSLSLRLSLTCRCRFTQVLTACRPIASGGRIADCLSIMAAGGHRNLPVVELERGVVEGQIAMRDILGFYLDFESQPEVAADDKEDFFGLFDHDDEREE